MPRAQGTHPGHQDGLYHPGCPQGRVRSGGAYSRHPRQLRTNIPRQSPAAGTGAPGQGEEPALQEKHLCQAEPPDGMERLLVTVPQPCQPPCPHPAPGWVTRASSPGPVLLHILAALLESVQADLSFPWPCSCLAASPCWGSRPVLPPPCCSRLFCHPAAYPRAEPGLEGLWLPISAPGWAGNSEIRSQ